MNRAIVWFRRDLSLEDNQGWSLATTTAAEVIPTVVLDDRLLDAAGPFRRTQYLASVGALAQSITECGGALTVLSGDPATALADLARELSADAVMWNGDVTRFARDRDSVTARRLRAGGVVVDTAWSTLVHPPRSVLTAAGTVSRVFTPYYRRWSDRPLAGHAEPGSATVLGVERDALPAHPDPPQAAGERAALTRLEQFQDHVDDYEHTRDRPDLNLTARISADLRFGVISPRVVVRAIGDSTPGRRAFVRQLAWRDWYAHLFAANPDLVDHCQQPAYEHIAWQDDPEEFAAWTAGVTGYPIVDAAMRELAATGWMHNRLRLITASFLVKDLLVDWRWGEQHFRRLLVDGDVPQNAGNWQWCAGTGPDAAPYFRVMNPIAQARRWDPDGAYVRRWLPELGLIPGAAVHAPWELGPLELAAAGVVLGDTYPGPIVDHAVARDRALAAYGAARAAAPSG